MAKTNKRRKDPLAFEEPIRSEIFSLARLETHAESLAIAQNVTVSTREGQDIAPRIRDNRRVLEAAYTVLLEAVAEHRAITPAAEWLIDNFHIVRAQLKDIHDHLPPRFYRELPKLADGPLKGFPRIYGIAWAFVAHTDSRFDSDLLKHFLLAYQRIQPLTMGELWAISITLRAVLIENLRRLAARMVNAQRARREADKLADEILGLGEVKARPLKQIMAEMEQHHFSRFFAVQLLQRLRFQDVAVDPILEWLYARLHQEGLSADEVVSTEHNSQTAANATVRNIILSARFMSVFDWQMFFEEVSLVDAELRTHAGYSQMDFISRDRYRHGLEELARFSPHSELTLARLVTAKASKAQKEPATDPGYYLISSGRRIFEQEVDFEPRWPKKIGRWMMRYSRLLFFLSIVSLAMGIVLATAYPLTWPLVLLSVIALFPASEISVAITNRAIVALLGPRYLPRLNFEKGIPPELKTFIVVPTFLTGTIQLAEQLEQLAIHYLANPDGNLRFALLTDWVDATVEVTPQDEELLRIAADKISALNEKIRSLLSGENMFYIFHRKRVFNPQEGKWMGWERKRGKLQEFNRLLLGHQDTTFIPLDQEPLKIPSGVRYVITIDADTKIPRGGAARLVGTLAHPLNRAHVDQQKKRVNHGYAILQPRITPSLPGTQDCSIFQRISAGPSGIDPYSSAISDVYQDLFEEGSYSGKGIYDVAAFAAVLAERVPENALLSHDLFESNFARCGFVSDLEFFEDFPSHSGVAALRTHRWMRGDWQLLPWIFGSRGKDIGMIGRWKMLDNLRRSLVAPMTFLLIVLPFMFTNIAVRRWLLLALSSLFIPAILIFITDLFPKKHFVSFWQHSQFTIRELAFGMERSLLELTLLPYRAATAIDAICRTLYRLLISHCHMLEWTTAAQTRAAARLTFASFWVQMRGALILTTLAGLAIALFNPAHLSWAATFLLLWGVSPALAHRFSSPPKLRPDLKVHPEDIQLLSASARHIWRFFATFVTEEDNFLPPDNFQEDPVPVVAHRSSPTNFGLYLLSVLAAHDFGWLGILEMAEKLGITLKSLEKLPKHQGHFFNWYETTGPRPLEPKYISSVDNGNLAAHLITLAEGCLQKLAEPVEVLGFSRGIPTTLSLLQEAVADMTKQTPETVTNDFSPILKHIDQMFLARDPEIIKRQAHWLELRAHADKLVSLAKGFKNDEVLAWARAFKSDIDSIARDFMGLVPWSEFALPITPEESLDWPPEAVQSWKQIQLALAESPRLNKIPAHCEKIIAAIVPFRRIFSDREPKNVPAFIDLLLESLEHSIMTSRELIGALSAAYQDCKKLCREMDFKLLYDPVRKLFSSGLRVSDNVLDAIYYDLLASETRLTSFIAIAKGDVPVSHWFTLSRTLTPVKGGAALVSWSGSMFEYLMPSLVMQTPRGSLLEQSCNLVIRQQIEYAESKGIPWGISESAYNKRDLHLTYQYSNFGVPELGLKRGLGDDLVIAPYASFLAAMYDPVSAADNLRTIAHQGGCGPFGFYEAIDFTASRLPPEQSFAVVRAYMAHHQGMSLVALANIFGNNIMQRRFHAEPLIQATELLLQERIPRNVGTIKPSKESYQIGIVREISEHVTRNYHTPHRPIPTTLLLSDGNYTVMLTSAGSGFSRYGDLALTRWREDVTRDHWGSYFYLRDGNSGKVWSASYQPTCIEADRYEVNFSEDRAIFVREDDGILCRLEIFISPEDSAEIRRITLTNTGEFTREIEITSYAEIVLNTHAADLAHPAFSNLFVQTEFVAELDTVVAFRRPRAAHEPTLWLGQVLLRDDQAFGKTQYETNRERFLGRGKSIRAPQAIFETADLTNSEGAVLDPIFSLRTKIRLQPGVPSNVTFSMIVAPTREDLIYRAEKFHDASTFDRVTNLAWTQAQIKLHYLNIEPVEAHQFQRLATRLLYADSSLRPSGEILKHNSKNITGLWAYGISGDFPIVLLRIDDIENRGIVRQILKAQEYLATKRFDVDLVILNEKSTSYTQELQNILESMVHSSMGVGHSPLTQSRGKIFILRRDLLPPADLDLLYAEARATLSSQLGNLAEQVKRMRHVTSAMKPRRKPLFLSMSLNREADLPIPQLEFFNGLGGFSADGREYVVVLKDTSTTPAPWLNIIANEQFGFQVSESGSGYTWASNSRENQLTPWSNDPVSDPSGEIFYILDRDSDQLWSPTAHPARSPDSVYITRHGQGYSRFEHLTHGIYSDLTQFVAKEDPVKISHLKLENRSTKSRKLAIIGYVEWVLGFSRATMAPTTVTEFDNETNSLFAMNVRNVDFGENVAFYTVLRNSFSFTGDRTEFIGRNGSLSEPKGIFQEDSLSGKMGAALDPCAAVQTEIELAPGEKIQICFLLGQAKNRAQARALVRKLRARDAQDILNEVISDWHLILGKVQVKTPDRALDLMLNRWWLYQTLTCRYWARAAFYQAGGAFGFRDQLQDVMALTLTRPDLAREHILRAASRQFIEGDVQHWWHPPSGRGVRTRFSDDLLWLPYVVSHYVTVSGDFAVLQEKVAFLAGPELPAGQEDAYMTPVISTQTASLYEHCARTLDRSLKTGIHGLPLMGSGDWNDGMNRVGHEGKGESVWLAWFLYTNLKQFAPLASKFGEPGRAGIWLNHSEKLKIAVEKEAWDGQWYRRAFYDDGTPLGAAVNGECQIDSLAQTWSVISGAGDPVRAKQAMEALDKFLIRPADQLVLLFTPPFDKTPKDPGYIKGYLPGVRENGGQYTQAAAWCVIAYAMMGQGKRAMELLTLLNSIHHALTPDAVERYKLEPYILAGDIYSEPPHKGRGGWSWYTGSSGWLYRAALEFVLGFKITGNELTIDPNITPEWDAYTIIYQHGASTYTIEIETQKISTQPKPLQPIQLVDDKQAHTIHLVLGKTESLDLSHEKYPDLGTGT